MTSRMLYLFISVAAVFSVVVSSMTGELVFKVVPSNFNRYELFGLVIYFSIVWTIYSLGNSQSAETENISLGPLRLMSFSIQPMIVIFMLTSLVLTFVFITA